MSYGKLETWKVVYHPINSTGGIRGVALIEAETHQMAMHTFSQLYRGQYFTIESCQKLIAKL